MKENESGCFFLNTVYISILTYVFIKARHDVETCSISAYGRLNCALKLHTMNDSISLTLKFPGGGGATIPLQFLVKYLSAKKVKLCCF